MQIISYGWPVTYWMLPSGCMELEMDVPNIICSRVNHATAAQKEYFRAHGKTILHLIVNVSALLATEGGLLAAMIEATDGHPVDGISLDELCLGKYTDAQHKEIQAALTEYRVAFPDKILHAWIGHSMSSVDARLIEMVYDLCDLVSPELYIRVNEPITAQLFFSRYRKLVDMTRTLPGVALHQDYLPPIGEDWKPHVEKQVRRIASLGCAGVGLWAPVHLRNAGERQALDELLINL